MAGAALRSGDLRPGAWVTVRDARSGSRAKADRPLVRLHLDVARKMPSAVTSRRASAKIASWSSVDGT
ncbi:hypothetical protein A5766_05535 [Gordonia sp. 852002-51296_SCH5728562-b]|nr:hypothetical protein A5766_05535 [Gordonia sp. 852002-51296_SCH5728562-b]